MNKNKEEMLQMLDNFAFTLMHNRIEISELIFKEKNTSKNLKITFCIEPECIPTMTISTEKYVIDKETKDVKCYRVLNNDKS